MNNAHEISCADVTTNDNEISCRCENRSANAIFYDHGKHNAHEIFYVDATTTDNEILTAYVSHNANATGGHYANVCDNATAIWNVNHIYYGNSGCCE